MNSGWKFRFGGAVCAGIGGGEVEAGLCVVFDGLAASHEERKIAADIQVVAHRRQLLAHVGGNAVFDQNFAADAEIAGDGEASDFHGGLQVHSVVDDVGDELGVGERLVGAAHDAESDVVVAVFHEGGNDGVEWAFMRG